jgi:hypothetical protein
LTIDNFNTTQSNKTVTNGAVVDRPINTSGAGVTYIGTSRTLSSRAAVGTSSSTEARINVAPNLSALHMNNIGSAGTVYVEWNGISGSASDFTEGGISSQFRINLPAPLTTSVSVAFLVNGTEEKTKIYLSGTSAYADFAFASFTTPNLFTNVTTLRMTMTGVASEPGWSATFGDVETVPLAVPLPGTLMLVGIGLAGLARSAKRA